MLEQLKMEAAQKAKELADKKEKELADKTREKDLLKKLRQRDAWKCTCKKFKPGSRTAHAALHDKMGHTQKCLLSPGRAGEQRWDGKNVGISKKDLEFLQSRNCKW